jgi:hypothetical protein
VLEYLEGMWCGIVPCRGSFIRRIRIIFVGLHCL